MVIYFKGQRLTTEVRAAQHGQQRQQGTAATENTRGNEMNEYHDDDSITEHPDGRLTLTYDGRDATVSPIPPAWPVLMCYDETCIRTAEWTVCQEPLRCGDDFPCRQFVACDDHGPAQLAVQLWVLMNSQPVVTPWSVEDERAEYGGHD